MIIVSEGDMTQDERDAILGRTRREYREARADLGAIRKRHAELVSEVKRFVLTLEEDPMRIYVSRGQRGALQAALEEPEAQYLYSAILANKLTLDSIGKHLDEYRATFDLAEDRRKSLIAQGDGDPSPTDITNS